MSTLREAIEALIADAEHAEHTSYDDGARSGPRTHEPGSDLYCPACWVHDLRAALGSTDHDLVRLGASWACAGADCDWQPTLGLDVRTEFDRHLREVRRGG